MDKLKTLISMILLQMLTTTVEGYSDADFVGQSAVFACHQRDPVGHNSVPQNGASPFEITLSGTTYSEGSDVTVTVATKSGESKFFRGFLVQGVREDNNERVGDFTVTDSAQSKLNCPNHGGRTITHTRSSSKSSVSFTWTAPLTDVGNVVFKFTIVELRIMYWANETSPVLTYVPTTGSIPTEPPSPTTTPTEPPTTPPMQAIPEVDVTDCGVTKSCFRNPETCDGSDCKFLVTWARNGAGGLAFEVQGTTAGNLGYIAIGFSKDASMGDDSVIDCIYTGEVDKPVDVQMSHNPGKSNDVLNDKYLGLDVDSTQGYYGDGRITCRFTRLIKLDDTSSPDADKIFDLSARNYNLLIAKGASSNGMKSYHGGGNDKMGSPQAFNFTDAPLNAGGSASYPLIKAHAILMIFAWMVSASFAILMPRYGKTAWPDAKWCGKQVWFQIHMPLMVCTFFLTIAGFIVIFVSVRGYAQYTELPAKAHPILGIITTALVIINPLMAAGRPHPGAPKRPIFNGFHFTVGLCAHVCSIATIFIGMYMPKANPPAWGKWVMVAFICWHVVIEICLAIHMRCCMKKEVSTPSKYEMTHPGSKSPITDLRLPHGSGWKTFFLILHLLGVLGLALALIIPIGQA